MRTITRLAFAFNATPRSRWSDRRQRATAPHRACKFALVYGLAAAATDIALSGPGGRA